MFIQDPDLDFLPIPDPGVKKAPDPGSATLLLSPNKLNFSMKNIIEVGDRSKKHTFEGTNAFLKAKKPGFS
jgi:hypothetical protein